MPEYSVSTQQETSVKQMIEPEDLLTLALIASVTILAASTLFFESILASFLFNGNGNGNAHAENMAASLRMGNVSKFKKEIRYAGNLEG
jgi:hypothetical protein